MDLTKLLVDALQNIASSATGANLNAVASIAGGLAGILNNLTSAQKNRLERKLRQKDVARLAAMIVTPTAEEIREFGSLYERVRAKTRPRKRGAPAKAAKKAAKKALPRKRATARRKS